jgi:hypothetical protein
VKRLGPVVVSIVTGLAAVVLLLAIWVAPPIEASPVLTATPSTEPPVFSATLSIAADREQLFIGETLTVTVDVTVSEGCIYPIFAITLKPLEDDEPVLTHVQPPTDTISGALAIPSYWTFRATQQGTVALQADTSGERYCGDYWNWYYLRGQTNPITVNLGPYIHWLPVSAGSRE